MFECTDFCFVLFCFFVCLLCLTNAQMKCSKLSHWTQEGAICLKKFSPNFLMGKPSQLWLCCVYTQDILLLKGEGEVKLNMVMGKGELALRSYGATGQEVVRSQLQEVEDAWATLLVTAMSCHRYTAHLIPSHKKIIWYFSLHKCKTLLILCKCRYFTAPF